MWSLVLMLLKMAKNIISNICWQEQNFVVNRTICTFFTMRTEFCNLASYIITSYIYSIKCPFVSLCSQSHTLTGHTHFSLFNTNHFRSLFVMSRWVEHHIFRCVMKKKERKKEKRDTKTRCRKPTTPDRIKISSRSPFLWKMIRNKKLLYSARETREFFFFRRLK